MNIYIMVDLEGISGVYDKSQVLSDGARFDEGRRFMTDDVNVVVRACKAAGVDKIYVRDAHGGSFTVIWDQLADEADYYVCGDVGEERMAGISDCDAVILLGYHAMAGTRAGLLEHSMSSVAIQNYRVNGAPFGEIGIDAAISGDAGLPVIMVSGDDKACAEARALLPRTVTAEVKRGITWKGAMLLPRQKAHALLAQKTREAIANHCLNPVPPLVLSKPVTLRVELVERMVPPYGTGKDYFTGIDARTFEVVGDTMQEALYRSW